MGGLDALRVVASQGGMNARGQFHVEGLPVAGIFEHEVVSAEFVSGTSGAVTNVMCDGGRGISGREMGGPAVPCDEAPDVFFGPGDPTWQVHFNSVWTLFENWRASVTLDAQGGNFLNGDYIAGQNTRHAEKTIKQDDAIWQGFRLFSRDGPRYTGVIFSSSARCLSDIHFRRAWRSVSARPRLALSGPCTISRHCGLEIGKPGSASTSGIRRCRRPTSNTWARCLAGRPLQCLARRYA